MDNLLSTPTVVDVSREALAFFPRGRVTIEANVYDRFVRWPSIAMRTHGIHLEERDRLAELLASAADFAEYGDTSFFACKALDALGQGDQAKREHFVLDHFVDRGQKVWMIRH